jgi:hypothetical protein
MAQKSYSIKGLPKIKKDPQFKKYGCPKAGEGPPFADA